MTKFSARTPQPFLADAVLRQVPANLWTRCPGCRALIYRRQLKDNIQVCPQCAFHFRLTVAEWIELLLDRNSFHSEKAGALSRAAASASVPTQREIESPKLPDPLVYGSGTIDGLPFELAISDFDPTDGALHWTYGEQLARSVECAIHRGVPLLTVNTSLGMRLDEGIVTVMQMAKVSSVLTMLARAHQPHIAILVDVCHSSIFASFIAGADVILAEPGATVRFECVGEPKRQRRLSFSAGCHTGEALLKQGMIDDVVPRAELRNRLNKLLRIYQS